MKITAVHVMIVIGVIWGILVVWFIGSMYYDDFSDGRPTVIVRDDDGIIMWVYRENGERDILRRDKEFLDYLNFEDIWLLSIIPITITAIIFSIFGMLKDDAKKILAAAILYVVPLFTIPSAVLCFICFAKIRKKKITAVRVMIIIAVIWGVIGLVRFGSDFRYEALGYGGDYDRFVANGQIFDISREEFIRQTEAQIGPYSYGAPFIRGLSFIVITITAIIFSIFGMLKDDAKKILVAAILYVVPLFTIPSAVLCFISFAKIRKRNVS